MKAAFSREMHDGLWGDAVCEWDGMGEVIDWVVFEALWASSLDGQAQRVRLNGSNDDVATSAQPWKSTYFSFYYRTSVSLYFHF